MLAELASILNERCEEEWQAYAGELPAPTPTIPQEEVAALHQHLGSEAVDMLEEGLQRQENQASADLEGLMALAYPYASEVLTCMEPEDFQRLVTAMRASSTINNFLKFSSIF